MWVFKGIYQISIVVFSAFAELNYSRDWMASVFFYVDFSPFDLKKNGAKSVLNEVVYR